MVCRVYVFTNVYSVESALLVQCVLANDLVYFVKKAHRNRLILRMLFVTVHVKVMYAT